MSDGCHGARLKIKLSSTNIRIGKTKTTKLVPTILETYSSIKNYYNNVLNHDKTLVKTTNDEPTPINCVEEMIGKIPLCIFQNPNLKWFDPCCGCGNFFVVVYKYLKQYHSVKHILTNMLYFNDINTDRTSIVKSVFCDDVYKLNITNCDYLEYGMENTYDIIVANPPYAKLMKNGKRASKNHNLIGAFINKSFELLREGGYLLFITPNNWMSKSNRNILIMEITRKQILHLNIHTAKKYFKKIGSSFTWYLIENVPHYKDITVEGVYKKVNYTSNVKSEIRSYIPLFYTRIIQSILAKTIDNKKLMKFSVETSSDLHKYTKKTCIRVIKDDTFKYKLHHTPSQTVWANRPHKFQEGYKVFIGTTSYYNVFVDDCGMTQSIAFIRCPDKKTAEIYKRVLEHPLYVFINNICRWGNFNNVRILQLFPLCNNHELVYELFNITNEEIEFISAHIKK